MIVAILLPFTACTGNTTNSISSSQHTDASSARDAFPWLLDSLSGAEYGFRGTASSVKLGVSELDADRGSLELKMIPDGAVTDIYIKLPVNYQSSGPVYVDWSEQLSGSFLTYAVLEDDLLNLGIAAIPEFDDRTVLPGTLDEAFDMRPVLDEDTLICTLRFSHGTENSTAKPVEVVKHASSLPDKVDDLELNDKDGMYEAGWPAHLKADYDQNGEVNIADMTPLAILMGMRSPAAGWLLEAHKRVDGDGNGEINIADLTPIGQNFGNTLTEFRLECSAGNESGPGSDWNAAGNLERSGITRSGSPVSSLGNPPYQRILTEATAGWPWYRVIAIDADGLESVPGSPVLAPDIVAPQWPDGPALEILENSTPTGIVLGFNENAVDDRGGAVQYGLQLTGALDGGEAGLAYIDLSGEFVPEPVSSPYKFTEYFDIADDRFQPIPFQGSQFYSVRLKAEDEDGNQSLTEWLEFESNISVGGSPPKLDISYDNWELWINREGTLRFKAPIPQYISDGSLEAWVYQLVVPLGEDPIEGNVAVEDFDPETRIPYTGQEITLQNAVGKDEHIRIGYELIANGESKFQASPWIGHSTMWMESLGWDYDEFNYDDPHRYLPDGRAFFQGAFRDKHGELQEKSWFLYSGNTLKQIFVDELAIDPDYSYSSIDYTPDGKLLIADPIGPGDPCTVTWFDIDRGLVSGKAEIPEGVFHWEFGGTEEVNIWIPEGDDTAIGLFNEARQDPESGEWGFQLWEARRDGSYSIRSYIPLPGLDVQSYASRLYLVNGRMVIAFLNSRGDSSSNMRFAAEQQDGSWLLFSRQDLPEDFDPSPYDGVAIGYQISWPDSFVIVNGSLGTGGPLPVQGGGLYKGDITKGFSSFTKVWEVGPDEAIDPEFPEITLDFNHFQWGPMPADGSFRGEPRVGNNSLAWIDGSGKVANFYAEDDYRTYFYRTNYYWKEGAIVPGLCNALLSEDGQWLAPYKEGQWGLAYWND